MSAADGSSSEVGDAHGANPARADGVAELAECRLRANSYLALRNVACDFRDGVLTLRGFLPNYYLKQLAQTAVAQIPGVRAIVNDIQVGTGTDVAGAEAGYNWRKDPPLLRREPNFLVPDQDAPAQGAARERATRPASLDLTSATPPGR